MLTAHLLLALLLQAEPDPLIAVSASAQKQCDGGSAADCADLGFVYHQAKDLARAVALYARACDLGDGGSCNNLAGLTDTGEGGVPNPVEAARLYERACDLGMFASCNVVSYWNYTGVKVPRNAARAVELALRGCVGGHAAACGNVGSYYLEGAGVPANRDEALRFWHRACELGDGARCAHLGQRCQEADGVAKDLNRAVQYYTRACDLGASAGCNNLALMTWRGEGVVANQAAANQLFQRACDAGYKPACEYLGTGLCADVAACQTKLYAAMGTPAILEVEIPLMLRMCELGSEYHCYYGALALLAPTGLAPAAPEAVAHAAALLAGSCGRGQAAACDTVAGMYKGYTYGIYNEALGAHFAALAKALSPVPFPRPPAAPVAGVAAQPTTPSATGCMRSFQRCHDSPYGQRCTTDFAAGPCN